MKKNGIILVGVVMKEKLKENVSTLHLDSKVIKKMKENGILTIEDLWVLKRKELKQLDFTDTEINQIVICLELYGFDLGKRIWKA